MNSYSSFNSTNHIGCKVFILQYPMRIVLFQMALYHPQCSSNHLYIFNQHHIRDLSETDSMWKGLGRRVSLTEDGEEEKVVNKNTVNMYCKRQVPWI